MLSAIDVVNEAVNDNGTFRTSGNDWYTTFGDSTYVMKAFQFARQYTVQYGEPQIKLYYNDYNTEFPAKADEIVRLCSPIFQAGYLDGIGMQEHNNNSTPTAQTFTASYNKFFPICSEMAVTVLDVATGSGSPSAAVLATQADQYGMLFKCFVERSYRSGRGKIINVSKDGLNDAYTFQANQSSSLWDALNKCKPSFFAVADVGMNYNSLDSLIAHGDSLQQDDYTPSSWSVFAAALASGKNVRSQNFSNATSADTALGLARDALRNAIAGLQRNPSVVNGNSGEAPEVFALSQNYPNPFNPTTTFAYDIPTHSQVRLTVYDITGRLVAELFNGVREPGHYVQVWNAANVASGMYLLRIEADRFSATRKMLLLR
jgi:hypothetical protein